MGILEREWITCCERAELDGVPQPPYLHQCGCPVVSSICVSEESGAELCGWEANPDYVATPPMRYTKLATAFSGQSFSQSGLCDYEDGEPVYSRTRTESWSGANRYSLDPLTCAVITDEFTGTETITLTFPAFVGECPGTDTSINTIDIENERTSVGGLNWFGCGSPSATSCTRIAPESYNSQTSVLTLSDPDTDLDAITRATPTAGTSCSSLSEIRSVDFDWTVRTASYALKATNLMIGAIYTARVEIESRPAIKDPAGIGYVDGSGEPAVWSSEDDEGAAMIDEYTFTATAREMIVPTTGTWSDANTDQVIDTAEVTPSIEIPHVAGMEYRIKNVRIELALTAAL